MNPQEPMRLTWWLGRVRRLMPTIFVICAVYGIYSLYASKPETKKQQQRIETDPTIPPLVHVTQAPSSKWTKWLIIHTNNDICNSVSSRFPGWMIMTVGSNKPKGYRYERCVDVSEDDLYIWRNGQNLETVDSLQVNVLAYLYAMKYGAEYIYLPGNSSSLSTTEAPAVYPEQNFTGLTYSAGQDFSPGEHYGCRIQRKGRRDNTRYKLCTHRTPAIQVKTSVNVVSQDESTEFGYTYPNPDCDSRTPPVALPTGVFVPFEPRDVLYTKDAFWALPFLYEDRELQYYNTQLWNLIAQKVLWLSGGRMLVHATESTLTSKLKFPNLEKVQLTLKEWQCKGKELFTCIMEIVKVLVEKHLVDSGIGPILHEWLKVLVQLKYVPPKLDSSVQEVCVSTDIIFHPVDYEQVVYRKSSRHKKPYIPVNNVQELYLTYMNTCSGDKNNAFNVNINFTHPWIQFDDVLLIITYNNPHYETIRYVETLYRPFFPYILHCGPGLPNLLDKTLRKYAFSFYSYGGTKEGHAKGSFNYECVTGAINMHYPVEGYLVISDDLLVSIYKTFDLRRYLAWYLPKEEIKTGDLKKLKECRLGMCDFYPHWHWWEDYQTQVLSLFARMEREQYTSPLINRCYRQLTLLNGGQFRANGAYSDIYYIPSRLGTEFELLASLFLEEDVFLEIAIPTILRCLENTEDMEILRGIASWDIQRDYAWMNFNKNKFLGKSYLHPTKWSYLASGAKEFKQFYCDKVLPYLHDNFGRLGT